MSLPTTQTADLIKTAAYVRASIGSPSSAQLTKADPWLRSCLNTIYKSKDLKILEQDAIQQIIAYVQKYTPPTDYDKLLGIKIFYGTHYGVSTAAAAGTITLAADEDITETEAKGKDIYLTSGTNYNQKSRIISYNETTKVAGVSPNWTTTPVGDEGYMIADMEKEVTPAPREMIDDVGIEEVPSYFYEYNGAVKFSSFVDTNGQYCMEIRYLLDPHYVDLTDSRMTKVYNELQEELIQGVYAYILNEDDDDRDEKEWARFERMVKDYKRKDSRKRRFRSHNFAKSVGGMPI